MAHRHWLRRSRGRPNTDARYTATGHERIGKYASFLPPWRFLSRLHGRRCRADATLLLLERANLGAVGLAVDLRLPRGFVCETPKGKEAIQRRGSSGPASRDDAVLARMARDVDATIGLLPAAHCARGHG